MVSLKLFNVNLQRFSGDGNSSDANAENPLKADIDLNFSSAISNAKAFTDTIGTLAAQMTALSNTFKDKSGGGPDIGQAIADNLRGIVNSINKKDLSIILKGGDVEGTLTQNLQNALAKHIASSPIKIKGGEKGVELALNIDEKQLESVKGQLTKNLLKTLSNIQLDKDAKPITLTATQLKDVNTQLTNFISERILPKGFTFVNKGNKTDMSITLTEEHTNNILEKLRQNIENKLAASVEVDMEGDIGKIFGDEQFKTVAKNMREMVLQLKSNVEKIVKTTNVTLSGELENLSKAIEGIKGKSSMEEIINNLAISVGKFHGQVEKDLSHLVGVALDRVMESSKIAIMQTGTIKGVVPEGFRKEITENLKDVDKNLKDSFIKTGDVGDFTQPFRDKVKSHNEMLNVLDTESQKKVEDRSDRYYQIIKSGMKDKSKYTRDKKQITQLTTSARKAIMTSLQKQINQISQIEGAVGDKTKLLSTNIAESISKQLETLSKNFATKMRSTSKDVDFGTAIDNIKKSMMTILEVMGQFTNNIGGITSLFNSINEEMQRVSEGKEGTITNLGEGVEYLNQYFTTISNEIKNINTDTLTNSIREIQTALDQLGKGLFTASKGALSTRDVSNIKDFGKTIGMSDDDVDKHLSGKDKADNIATLIQSLGENFEGLRAGLAEANQAKEQGLDQTIPEFTKLITAMNKNFKGLNKTLRDRINKIKIPKTWDIELRKAIKSIRPKLQEIGQMFENVNVDPLKEAINNIQLQIDELANRVSTAGGGSIGSSESGRYKMGEVGKGHVNIVNAAGAGDKVVDSISSFINKTFPDQLKGMLSKGVRLDKVKDGTGAFDFARDKTGKLQSSGITIDPGMYSNEKMRKAFSKDVASGRFAGIGNQPMESVVMHEFGHLLDSILSKDMPKDLGITKDYMKLRSGIQKSGVQMSGYGAGSIEENMAELFTHMMSGTGAGKGITKQSNELKRIYGELFSGKHDSHLSNIQSRMGGTETQDPSKAIEARITELNKNFAMLESNLAKAIAAKKSGLDKSIPLFKQHITNLGTNFSKLTTELGNTDISKMLPNLKKLFESLVSSVAELDVQSLNDKDTQELAEQMRTITTKLAKVLSARLAKQAIGVLTDTTDPEGAGQLEEVQKKVNQVINHKMRSIGQKLAKGLYKAVDNMRLPKLNLDDSFKIDVTRLNKTIQERLASSMGFKGTTDDFVKANPVLQGFESLRKLTEARMQLANQQFTNRFEQQSTHTLKQLTKTFREMPEVKPDLSIIQGIDQRMMELQQAVVDRVKKMIEQQFNTLLKEVRGMKVIPASIGAVHDRTMPIPKAPKAIHSIGRSASNLDILPMDDTFKPAAPVVTGMPGVSKGVVNPGFDTNTGSFAGAIKNTLRYIMANRLFTMPMRAMHTARQTGVEFDYTLEKARQNLLAKYGSDETPFRRLAEEQVESRFLQAEELKKLGYDEFALTKEQYDNLEYREKLIEQETDLLNRASREGSKRVLQNLALDYGIDLTEVGKMWQIATRTYDSPFDAQKMVAAASRIYGSSPGEINPEDAARGMESVKAQWGVAADQLSDFADMMMKTELMSQATVKDVLDAHRRSGAVLRSLMPQEMDKREQFATANALISMFITATARSGSEAGTMWRTVLARPYRRNETEMLENIAIQHNIPELMPYTYEERNVHGAPTKVTHKGGTEMFLNILEGYSKLRDTGRDDVALDMMSQVFQRRNMGNAMAIAAFMEDLDRMYEHRGTDGVRGLIEDIKDTDGMDAYVSELQGTLRQRGARAGAAWQVASSDLVESFKPEVGELVDALTGLAVTVRDNSEWIGKLLNVGVKLLAMRAIGKQWDKHKGKIVGAMMNTELAAKVDPLVAQNKSLMIAREEKLGQADDATRKFQQLAEQKGVSVDAEGFIKDTYAYEDTQKQLELERKDLAELEEEAGIKSGQRKEIEDAFIKHRDRDIAEEIRKSPGFEDMPEERKQAILDAARQQHDEESQRILKSHADLDDDGAAEAVKASRAKVRALMKQETIHHSRVRAHELQAQPFDEEIKKAQQDAVRLRREAASIEGKRSVVEQDIDRFNRAYTEAGATKTISPTGEVTKLGGKSKDKAKEGAVSAVTQGVQAGAEAKTSAVTQGMAAGAILGLGKAPVNTDEFFKKHFDNTMDIIPRVDEAREVKGKEEKHLSFLGGERKALAEKATKLQDEIDSTTDPIEKERLKEQLDSTVESLITVDKAYTEQTEVVNKANETFEALNTQLSYFMDKLTDFNEETFKATQAQSIASDNQEELNKQFDLQRVTGHEYLSKTNENLGEETSQLAGAMNKLTSVLVGNKLLGRLGTGTGTGGMGGLGRAASLMTGAGAKKAMAGAGVLAKGALKKVPALALGYAALSNIGALATRASMRGGDRANAEFQALAKRRDGAQAALDRLNEGRYVASVWTSLTTQLSSLLDPAVGWRDTDKILKGTFDWEAEERKRARAVQAQEASRFDEDSHRWVTEGGERRHVDFDRMAATSESMKENLEWIQRNTSHAMAMAESDLATRMYEESYRSRSTSHEMQVIARESVAARQEIVRLALEDTQNSLNAVMDGLSGHARDAMKHSPEYKETKELIADYTNQLEELSQEANQIIFMAIDDIRADFDYNQSQRDLKKAIELTNLNLRGFGENTAEVINATNSILQDELTERRNNLKRKERKIQGVANEEDRENLQKDINQLEIDINNLMSEIHNNALSRFDGIAQEADLDIGMLEARTSKRLADLYTKGYDEESVAYRRIQEEMLKDVNQELKDSIKELEEELKVQDLDNEQRKQVELQIAQTNAQIAENTRNIFDLWNNRGTWGLPDGVSTMTDYEYHARRSQERSMSMQAGGINVQFDFGDVYANSKEDIDRLSKQIVDDFKKVLGPNTATHLNHQSNGYRHTRR